LAGAPGHERERVAGVAVVDLSEDGVPGVELRASSTEAGEESVLVVIQPLDGVDAASSSGIGEGGLAGARLDAPSLVAADVPQDGVLRLRYLVDGRSQIDPSADEFLRVGIKFFLGALTLPCPLIAVLELPNIEVG
jgi:hypothetical protein